MSAFLRHDHPVKRVGRGTEVPRPDYNLAGGEEYKLASAPSGQGVGAKQRHWDRRECQVYGDPNSSGLAT